MEPEEFTPPSQPTEKIIPLTFRKFFYQTFPKNITEFALKNPEKLPTLIAEIKNEIEKDALTWLEFISDKQISTLLCQIDNYSDKGKIYKKSVWNKEGVKTFSKEQGNLLIIDTTLYQKIIIAGYQEEESDKEYHKQDRNTKEIIQAAEKVGVKYILNTGQDMPTNQLLLRQLAEFPNLYGALGLHPNKLAQKYNLPVLLHIRGEEDEKKFIEAFNEAYELFLDLGFYISFAGNITYKNAKGKDKWGEVLERAPLERIVVETDAPYLSPEPLRGKGSNYPQNIIYTLKKIAEVKKMNLEEVGEQIYFNTLQLFGLLRREGENHGDS
ncbi:18804_t:CDS:2 [Funneliformis geosporum]|nr:18804_t:CDS:2 [Funneliformis geosporum]